MTEELKLMGANRRDQLLLWLKESTSPLTGENSQKANVSRQVIVQDISLLKAKMNRLSPQAKDMYTWMRPLSKDQQAERIIACLHGPERTEEELRLIVDEGVTVKDVKLNIQYTEI